jgi:hypothetical protein
LSDGVHPLADHAITASMTRVKTAKREVDSLIIFFCPFSPGVLYPLSHFGLKNGKRELGAKPNSL